MLRNDMTPMQYRIRFRDGDIGRVHYTDDPGYFEQLVARHGHLSELRIEPLTLTAEQQQRLDNLPAGLTPHDAGVYVRYGTAEDEDSPHYDPALIAAYHRDQAEPAIKAQRKQREAEGVVLNGICYTGDPGARQAMQEAITAATDLGLAAFDAWKCTDGSYCPDHPVADVDAALRQIGRRRSALIALEAQHVAAVAAGEADPMALDWSTPHDS